VNFRSACWARAFTSTALARSTIQASACRQLPLPKSKKEKNDALLVPGVFPGENELDTGQFVRVISFPSVS